VLAGHRWLAGWLLATVLATCSPIREKRGRGGERVEREGRGRKSERGEKGERERVREERREMGVFAPSSAHAQRARRPPGCTRPPATSRRHPALGWRRPPKKERGN